MPRKSSASKLRELKGYVQDYIDYMHQISEDRVENAERELAFVQKEMVAFTFLCQNVTDMEEHGIS